MHGDSRDEFSSSNLPSMNYFNQPQNLNYPQNTNLRHQKDQTSSPQHQPNTNTSVVMGIMYPTKEEGAYKLSKYGHTKRVTRLSNEVVDILKNNRDWTRDPVLRKTVYGDPAIRLTREDISRVDWSKIPLMDGHGKRVLGTGIMASVQNDGRVKYLAEIKSEELKKRIKSGQKIENPYFSIGYSFKTNEGGTKIKELCIKEVSMVRKPVWDGTDILVACGYEPGSDGPPMIEVDDFISGLVSNNEGNDGGQYPKKPQIKSPSSSFSSPKIKSIRYDIKAPKKVLEPRLANKVWNIWTKQMRCDAKVKHTTPKQNINIVDSESSISPTTEVIGTEKSTNTKVIEQNNQINSTSFPNDKSESETIQNITFLEGTASPNIKSFNQAEVNMNGQTQGIGARPGGILRNGNNTTNNINNGNNRNSSETSGGLGISSQRPGNSSSVSGSSAAGSSDGKKSVRFQTNQNKILDTKNPQNRDNNNNNNNNNNQNTESSSNGYDYTIGTDNIGGGNFNAAERNPATIFNNNNINSEQFDDIMSDPSSEQNQGGNLETGTAEGGGGENYVNEDEELLEFNNNGGSGNGNEDRESFDSVGGKNSSRNSNKTNGSGRNRDKDLDLDDPDINLHNLTKAELADLLIKTQDRNRQLNSSKYAQFLKTQEAQKQTQFQEFKETFMNSGNFETEEQAEVAARQMVNLMETAESNEETGPASIALNHILDVYKKTILQPGHFQVPQVPQSNWNASKNNSKVDLEQRKQQSSSTNNKSNSSVESGMNLSQKQQGGFSNTRGNGTNARNNGGSGQKTHQRQNNNNKESQTPISGVVNCGDPGLFDDGQKRFSVPQNRKREQPNSFSWFGGGGGGSNSSNGFNYNYNRNHRSETQPVYQPPNKSQRGIHDEYPSYRSEENALLSSENYVAASRPFLELWNHLNIQLSKKGGQALPPCEKFPLAKKSENILPYAKEGTDSYQEFFSQSQQFLKRDVRSESSGYDILPGVICFGLQNHRNSDGSYNVQCGETTDYDNPFDLEQSFPEAQKLKQIVKSKNLPFFENMNESAWNSVAMLSAVDPEWWDGTGAREW